MSYSKHGGGESSPIQDLFSSAVFGIILGIVLYTITEQTGALDMLLGKLGMPGLGGRLGPLQFVIFGGIFGIVTDLFGKLVSRGRRSQP